MHNPAPGRGALRIIVAAVVALMLSCGTTFAAPAPTAEPSGMPNPDGWSGLKFGMTINQVATHCPTYNPKEYNGLPDDVTLMPGLRGVHVLFCFWGDTFDGLIFKPTDEFTPAEQRLISDYLTKKYGKPLRLLYKNDTNPTSSWEFPLTRIRLSKNAFYLERKRQR